MNIFKIFTIAILKYLSCSSVKLVLGGHITVEFLASVLY